MLRILHFADAHIDMASQGRHDPATGLPVRVLDFLKALDTIVDTAISEKVDLVLFAGDAYKDRSPAPTFQREWGRRIFRLSQAGIPVLLLVGNHDLSPALGRAHALQEFDTLQVPNVLVISQPRFLGPSDLWGLPLQLIAIPWVTRSAILASQPLDPGKPAEVGAKLEARIQELVEIWLESLDPALPLVLAAHASVQGATYGSERKYAPGGDFELSGNLFRRPQLDYVALGHMHKAQDLGEDLPHPIVYPGSIERVDWGEVEEDKFFVIANIEKGKKTQVEWRKLEGRRFIDKTISIKTSDDITNQIIAKLPAPVRMKDAMVRMTVYCPREWDVFIDEQAIRNYAGPALEFHMVRHLEVASRFRLPRDRPISSFSPQDLLELYWKTLRTEPDEAKELQKLADGIIKGGV